MKIILVEDNADLAQSMQMLLSLQGHEARIFLTSQQLLDEAACTDDADLVVSDYYLPDLNGVELIKRLRARRPGLQAVLLTGSREESIVRAASRIADCDILHKPLDCEELTRTLESLNRKAA